jgi:hypothetical protein
MKVSRGFSVKQASTFGSSKNDFLRRLMGFAKLGPERYTDVMECGELGEVVVSLQLGRMFVSGLLGRKLAEAILTYFKILSLHSLEGTGGKH